jgi:hypothetical protein
VQLCCSLRFGGMADSRSCYLSLLCADVFHLITEYLPNLQDLMNFDTSLSHLPLRELFHSSLNHSSHFINLKSLSSHQIHWLSSKNILISSICCQKFDQNTLQYLQKFHHSIKKLDFHLCNLISNANLLQLLGPNIPYPSLTSLSLSHCRKITNKNLIEVLKSQKSSQFQFLDLSFTTSLSSEIATSLVKYCPHLVELNLSSNLWVTDETIQILTTGCPRLKIIDLQKTRITDVSIEKIMATYPHLQLLQFLDCPITEQSISKVMNEIVFRSLLIDDPRLNDRVLTCLSEYLWEGKTKKILTPLTIPSVGEMREPILEIINSSNLLPILFDFLTSSKVGSSSSFFH